MEIKRKIYTTAEVKELIASLIKELKDRISGKPYEGWEQLMDHWADDYIPVVIDLLGDEILGRHPQGVTIAVWAGPPGSGKGTNIDTVSLLGQAYAEYTSQGGAEMLIEPYHSFLLQNSLSQGMVVMGTKGIFNMPENEYLEMFGELQPITGEQVARGGFPPDDVASLLALLMILYRLTQGYHRIQMDLWPRKLKQFVVYKTFVAAMQKVNAKVMQELVSLRVLSDADVEVVRKMPLESANASVKIGELLAKVVSSAEYKEKVELAKNITDPVKRFAQEKEYYENIMTELEKEMSEDVAKIVISELRLVFGRMEFRFNNDLKNSVVMRADAYPLSLIKRLMIFAAETSPAFLYAAGDKTAPLPVSLVTTISTPDVVVSKLLDELVGHGTALPTDTRWNAMKELAGKIAIDVVNVKRPVVSDLVKTVGGIFTTNMS